MIPCNEVGLTLAGVDSMAAAGIRPAFDASTFFALAMVMQTMLAMLLPQQHVALQPFAPGPVGRGRSR